MACGISFFLFIMYRWTNSCPLLHRTGQFRFQIFDHVRGERGKFSIATGGEARGGTETDTGLYYIWNVRSKICRVHFSAMG